MIWTLVASYGLCFGLMNDKAWFLTDRLRAIRLWVITTPEGDTTLFERMLRCPYCTGFHTGWIAWLLGVAASWSLPVASADVAHAVVGNAAHVGTVAFASAAFCYMADTLSQWLESSMK